MAAPSYTAAKASTLSTDAGGAWAHTTAAPAGAGELIIVHVFQDGTSAADAITIDSATNANKLDGSGTGYTPLRATGFPVGDVNTPTGYHYIFLARSTGTNASVITGGNTGTNDIYVRTYQFGGVHAGLDVAHILENVTPGVAVSTAGTSTSVAAVSVTALGTERLALCFIAVADDIQGAELTAMAGESGGDWTYPVAAAGSSTGTDGTLGLVTATPDSGLVITGGADAITSEAWGTLGFALRPTTAVLVHNGASNNPVTFGAVTAGHDISFTYQWQHTPPGENDMEDIVGETGTTYLIVEDDIERRIQCVVTAVKDGTSLPTDQTSNHTDRVTAAGVTAQVDTSLVFTAVVQGQATRHGQVDAPVTVNRVTAARVTAKAASATPTTATVVTQGRVTAKAASSTPTTFTAVTAGSQTVRGRVAFPITLDAVTTSLSPITYAYQWQRDTAGDETYTDIGGATDPTYVLQAEDVGCHVRCEVTATDDNGSTVADSNATDIVTASAADIFGQVAAPFTFNRTISGRVTPKAASTTPTTATFVTQGRVTAKAQVAAPFTIGRVTAGRVTARGQVAAPFTVNRTTAGYVTEKAAVAFPITFAAVVDSEVAGAIAGQVDTPVTFGVTTTGRVTAKAAAALPVTFSTNIVGQVGAITYTYQWQRDTLGNSVYEDISSATGSTYVLQEADHGSHVRCEVTATDDAGSTVIDSNSVGLVTADVTGQVATALVFGAVTDGAVAGHVTGQVSTIVTFGAVTDGTVGRAPDFAAAGLIYMFGDYAVATTGAVDLPIQVNRTVTGKVAARSQVATLVAFASTTTGLVTAKGQVDTQLQLDAVTNGSIGGSVTGEVTLPVTAGISTSGRVTAKGQAATALTAAVTTVGRITAKATVAFPVAATIVTAAARTARALVSTVITAARTVTGRVSSHGQVALPVTLGIVTEGQSQGGAARFTATATITTAGRVTARGQVSLPVTLTSVVDGGGIPRIHGQASLPVTVASSVTGRIDAHGQVAFPATVDSQVTGRVDAHATIDAVFTLTTTSNGRHVRYGSLTLPIIFHTTTTGVTQLPGTPTIGQILHSRIGTLDDTIAGHLDDNTTGQLEEATA